MIRIITEKDCEEKFERKVNSTVSSLATVYNVDSVKISHSSCQNGNYGVTTVFMCVIEYSIKTRMKNVDK